MPIGIGGVSNFPDFGNPDAEASFERQRQQQREKERRERREQEQENERNRARDRRDDPTGGDPEPDPTDRNSGDGGERPTRGFRTIAEANEWLISQGYDPLPGMPNPGWRSWTSPDPTPGADVLHDSPGGPSGTHFWPSSVGDGSLPPLGTDPVGAGEAGTEVGGGFGRGGFRTLEEANAWLRSEGLPELPDSMVPQGVGRTWTPPAGEGVETVGDTGPPAPPDRIAPIAYDTGEPGAEPATNLHTDLYNVRMERHDLALRIRAFDDRINPLEAQLGEVAALGTVRDGTLYLPTEAAVARYQRLLAMLRPLYASRSALVAQDTALHGRDTTLTGRYNALVGDQQAIGAPGERHSQMQQAAGLALYERRLAEQRAFGDSALFTNQQLPQDSIVAGPPSVWSGGTAVDLTWGTPGTAAEGAALASDWERDALIRGWEVYGDTDLYRPGGAKAGLWGEGAQFGQGQPDDELAGVAYVYDPRTGLLKPASGTPPFQQGAAAAGRFLASPFVKAWDERLGPGVQGAAKLGQFVDKVYLSPFTRHELDRLQGLEATGEGYVQRDPRSLDYYLMSSEKYAQLPGGIGAAFESPYNPKLHIGPLRVSALDIVPGTGYLDASQDGTIKGWRDYALVASEFLPFLGDVAVRSIWRGAGRLHRGQEAIVDAIGRRMPWYRAEPPGGPRPPGGGASGGGWMRPTIDDQLRGIDYGAPAPYQYPTIVDAGGAAVLSPTRTLPSGISVPVRPFAASAGAAAIPGAVADPTEATQEWPGARVGAPGGVRVAPDASTRTAVEQRAAEDAALWGKEATGSRTEAEAIAGTRVGVGGDAAARAAAAAQVRTAASAVALPGAVADPQVGATPRVGEWPGARVGAPGLGELGGIGDGTTPVRTAAEVEGIRADTDTRTAADTRTAVDVRADTAARTEAEAKVDNRPEPPRLPLGPLPLGGRPRHRRIIPATRPRSGGGYPREVAHAEVVEHRLDPRTGRVESRIVHTSPPVVVGWDATPPQAIKRDVGVWSVTPGRDGIDAMRTGSPPPPPSPKVLERMRAEAKATGQPALRRASHSYFHDLDRHTTDRQHNYTLRGDASARVAAKERQRTIPRLRRRSPGVRSTIATGDAHLRVRINPNDGLRSSGRS